MADHRRELRRMRVILWVQTSFIILAVACGLLALVCVIGGRGNSRLLAGLIGLSLVFAFGSFLAENTRLTPPAATDVPKTDLTVTETNRVV